MTCTINLEPLIRIIIDASTAIPPPLTPSQINAYLDAIRSASRLCSSQEGSSEVLTNPRDEYSPDDIEVVLDDYTESDVRTIVAEFESSGFYSTSNASALLSALDSFLAPPTSSVLPGPTCVDDDLDSSLLDFTNLVASIYRESRRNIDTLASTTSVPAISESLDSSVRSALSGSVVPYDELVSNSCLGPTPDDRSISDSLSSRYGVHIINGRLIPDGDFSLIGIRRLVQLVGSLDVAIGLLPEIEEARLSSSYTPDPRYVYVVTALTEDSTGLRFADTACVPASIKSSIPCKDAEINLGEVVISINSSIESALESDPSYLSSTIVENFFWVGIPSMTSGVRSNTNRLNISDQTIFSAISLTQSEELQSYEIDVVGLYKFIDYYGPDAESIILSGPESVPLLIDPMDVVSAIEDALSVRPGGFNDCGARDFSDPATQILTLIDFNRSIPDDLSDCADSSIELGDINSAINRALNSPNEAISDLSKVFAPLTRIIGNLSSVVSIIQNFINDRTNLDCIMGPGFSYSTGASVGDTGLDFSSKLDSMSLVLQGGIGDINRFFLDVGQILNGFSQLSCTLGFITQAFKKPKDSFSGIGCEDVNNMALLPPCYSATMDIGSIRANVAFRLATQAIRNVRDLIIQIEQIGIELAANASNESNIGCISSETSTLVRSIKDRISNAGFS